AGTTNFTFTVTLSTTADQPITVDYSTADGSATTADGDYVGQSGTLTFAPGVTSQTITVLVNGDLKVEGDETFNVNLSNARYNGATDASRVDITDAQGVGTITNDDTAHITISDVTASEGNAGTTNFTFTVTLSTTADQPITVDYSTADGSATTADGDYV